jgi:selenide,water dikinase
MTMLNKTAAEVITQERFHGAVHAATDVTGFGMIGHAREMALASGVSLRIDASSVAALPGAMDCIRAGFIPGGLTSNEEFAKGCVEFAAGVSEEMRKLFFDPQTAGGLLLSVESNRADEVTTSLGERGIPAVRIGAASAKTGPLILVDQRER